MLCSKSASASLILVSLPWEWKAEWVLLKLCWEVMMGSLDLMPLNFWWDMYPCDTSEA